MNWNGAMETWLENKDQRAKGTAGHQQEWDRYLGQTLQIVFLLDLRIDNFHRDVERLN
jgi:hypothetical protein